PGLILLGASMLFTAPQQFLVYGLVGNTGSTEFRIVSAVIRTLSFITDWLEIAAVTSLLCVFYLWLKQRRHN
ncbi:MAG: hypothetical protein IJ334_13915, partial [Clostridia bacterium]|nr:hypothetical protein [Clostridia bacterium]